MSALQPDQPKPMRCQCGGAFSFQRYCGAHVCDDCGQRKGLARCYCGWSESGGSGYQELLEMGECIELDDY